MGTTQRAPAIVRTGAIADPATGCGVAGVGMQPGIPHAPGRSQQEQTARFATGTSTGCTRAIAAQNVTNRRQASPFIASRV
jgi:hypothetical protein